MTIDGNSAGMKTFTCITAAAVLVAFVSGAAALTNGTAITESAAISAQPATAFVYNPIASNTLMVKYWTKIQVAGMMSAICGHLIHPCNKPRWADSVLR